MDLTNALETYEEHQLQYDYIKQRLNDVRNTINNAPRAVQKTLLWLADTYALITSNTKVEAHDLAFAGLIRSPFDEDHIRNVLHPDNTRARASGEHVVLYYNNKAEYIQYNMAEVNYDEQARLFEAGRYNELHAHKVEQVKGIRETKAAFSMAMSGILEKACLDSNMVRACNVDTDLQHVSVDEYDEIVEQCRAQTPALAGQTPPFLWQWIVWDHVRDSAVTTHDAWFLGVNVHSSRQTTMV